MKKILLSIMVLFIISCKKEAVPKPDNLIEMEQMEKILYDLSLLQALRSTSKPELDSAGIDPKTYVYQKYKIDSLQFANSNAYYAAKDLKKYERMYKRVNEKLQAEKKVVDSLAKNNPVKPLQATPQTNN
ncbi:DUF4296 domain-containing protein [Flavobacterium sp. NST-5]|uniref:DUF4296 domain-containing protein n=1 Tax=Flavobacterium ichthyis TaxID=2698827 RepID=A0ABW9ZAZ8_9FLAO|nr:DUF4296 domain-containing protein [Flavobacterium ichthyis]NBL66100.1 DUF4296 domain-containing protein [Flavobacterium ichthyis]